MLTRMMTAAAFAALMAGSAYAQDPALAKPQDHPAQAADPATGDAHMNADGSQTGDVGTMGADAMSSGMAAPAPMTGATTTASMGPAPVASVTTTTVTNGPVPDTPENRAKYGGPMSNGGKKTAPAGN